jgi:adenylate cyclase
VRDDTQTPEKPKAPRLLARVGGRMVSALRAIPWHNAKSLRWWGRWFRRSMMQSGRVTTILALFGLLAWRYEDPYVFQLLRARVFDAYQKIQPRTVAGESPVVILDIDEKSIQELGQFPWPRTVVADLVANATKMGVSVMGFDIVFADADQTSVARVTDAIPDGLIDRELRARLKKVPTNDEVLAQAIAASGKVVLGQTVTSDAVSYAGKPHFTSFAEIGDPRPFLERHLNVLRPLPVLSDAAAGWGMFSIAGKFFDGVVRQVPMVLTSKGQLYPALVLEMLRVNLGGKTIGIKTNDVLGVQQIFIRIPHSRERYVVPTDENAVVWPYFRSHESWKTQYISATDVIHNRVAPERLAGKFALVGMSAQGLLADLRSTPLDAVVPGVEVHANIIENIVFNDQLKRPSTAVWFELAATAVIGILMIILTPMVGIFSGLGVFMVLSGGLAWWSWQAFVGHLELYDPVFPIAAAFFFYFFLALSGYLRTESQRKQVRSAFGQYLSPALVAQLANDPSRLTLGGENRDMTFMFSDVRGFTSISELFDAQGLTRLINRLLTPLTDAILKTEGTIDKYMGDCVMAFWNAPLDVKDHASHACRAALSMIQAVDKVNETLEAEAKTEGREHRPLAIGIGINSGVACVGNMGSEQRFDYSVLGDNVNLASRLEGQSKAYGVTIVLGENAAAKAPEFAVLELDLIKVKGKSEAVRIFTLVGDQAVATAPWFAKLKSAHRSALSAYRRQEWREAGDHMKEAEAIIDGQPGLVQQIREFYEVLSDRIYEFRVTPPPVDWDGVYVATSK